MISPRTSTRPVVVAVSQATRASGSSRMIASRIASETWSHILSGCPSVTDSEVNRYCEALTMLVIQAPLRTFRPRVPSAAARLDSDVMDTQAATSNPMPTADADPAALDAADPLAAFRDRFVIPDPELLYLDGNSLGRPPLAALERLARVASRGVGGRADPRLGPLARRAAPGRRPARDAAPRRATRARSRSATRRRSTSTGSRAPRSTPDPAGGSS